MVYLYPSVDGSRDRGLATFIPTVSLLLTTNFSWGLRGCAVARLRGCMGWIVMYKRLLTVGKKSLITTRSANEEIFIILHRFSRNGKDLGGRMYER